MAIANTTMLAAMRYCRNFFLSGQSETGLFEVKQNSIIVRGEYKAGQYVAITGSDLSNGIYKIVEISRRTESGVETGESILWFTENPDNLPEWEQPSGPETAYNKDDLVWHVDGRYISLVDANTYEPGTNATIWERQADMADESFTGTVYGLRAPVDFVALVGEIETFNETGGGIGRGYVREGVMGEHDWAKPVSPKTGGVISWQEQYASQLSNYTLHSYSLDI